MAELIVESWVLIAALVFILACFGTLLYLQKQLAALRSRQEQQERQLERSQQQCQSLQQELQELRSGTIGVGRRVLEFEKKLARQDTRIEESLVQEPQARLYSRAMKMVSLGAGVEELMRECELPKAEAELLLRLHTRP